MTRRMLQDRIHYHKALEEQAATMHLRYIIRSSVPQSERPIRRVVKHARYVRNAQRYTRSW
jgi:hypothetical protein